MSTVTVVQRHGFTEVVALVPHPKGERVLKAEINIRWDSVTPGGPLEPIADINWSSCGTGVYGASPSEARLFAEVVAKAALEAEAMVEAARIVGRLR